MAGLAIVALAALACGIVEPEVGEGARGKADSDNGFAADVQPLCEVSKADRKAIAEEAEQEGISWAATERLQSLLDEHATGFKDDDYEVVSDHNQVTLLVDGAESYEQRYKNIANAEVVLLKTYNFRDDETGTEVLRRLRKVADQGGETAPLVFIQFDRKGFKAAGDGAFWNSMKMLFGGRHGFKAPVPGLLKDAGDDDKGLFHPLRGSKNAFVMPVNMPVGLWNPFNADAYREFNPIFGKDHEKYLITWSRGEGVRVVMGGLNTGSEWAYAGTQQQWKDKKGHEEYGYRDTDVEIVGPATHAIVREFLHDALYHWEKNLDDLKDSAGRDGRKWHEATQPGIERLKKVVAAMEADDAAFAEAADGTARVRFVANRPHEGAKGQYIERLLCVLLKAAPEKTAVRMSNAFVFPPPTFEAALRDAVDQGIELEMLLNNENAHAPFGMLAKGARCMLGKLFGHPTLGEKAKEAVTLYRWPGGDTKENLERNADTWAAVKARGVSTIHQKVWAFGGKPNDPLLIGSSNLDYHSLRHNSEGAVLIEDPALKEAFDAMLTQDFELARKHGDMTLEDRQVSAVVPPAEIEMKWEPGLMEKLSEQRGCLFKNLIKGSL
jgi:phosphatidylserine/phosphatidylglycerophosphate/cardiolipin synthase-like enzyme